MLSTLALWACRPSDDRGDGARSPRSRLDEGPCPKVALELAVVGGIIAGYRESAISILRDVLALPDEAEVTVEYVGETIWLGLGLCVS